ncbi:polysaccharide biosynthesis/export family protein [Futiania mangrovi]|uniref:Polysaccharide export protein n=1 Tax=Futiania mangrovi TaxID=2959716 RepID=A0A9J6PC51_9PROT|nr:polysaccharide biosynthesis/export family protein [Futiania mangrovii]MCP1335352.1 polysaccharide export protein [Futiania mangrovii]
MWQTALRHAAALLLLTLAACTGTPAGVEIADGPALEARAPLLYRLGPGDEVRLIVFGEDNLSGTFAVDAEGTLAMPLIGAVQAAGLSVRELEEAVARRLADGYLLDPKVSAQIAVYRPYTILGEVARPGSYPYAVGLGLLDAVAAAGGYSYRARTGVVHIVAEGERVARTYKAAPDLPVYPGDQIVVPERYF